MAKHVKRGLISTSLLDDQVNQRPGGRRSLSSPRTSLWTRQVLPSANCQDWQGMGRPGFGYPLVNVYIAKWKLTIFERENSLFLWPCSILFNSYVSHYYQRVPEKGKYPTNLLETGWNRNHCLHLMRWTSIVRRGTLQEAQVLLDLEKKNRRTSRAMVAIGFNLVFRISKSNKSPFFQIWRFREITIFKKI